MDRDSAVFCAKDIIVSLITSDGFSGMDLDDVISTYQDLIESAMGTNKEKKDE